MARIARAFLTIAIPAALGVGLVVLSRAIYGWWRLPWYFGMALDINESSARDSEVFWVIQATLVAVLARVSRKAGWVSAAVLWCFPTAPTAALSLLAGDHGHYENIISCVMIAAYGGTYFAATAWLVSRIPRPIAPASRSAELDRGK